jgi:transcriptional regulator with XRE-family HTH domain
VSTASIAVLPFENLSTDKDNEFFATGIQDEILTRLAKIGSLKVISRTSTANLGARPGNLPKLAEQLGVSRQTVQALEKGRYDPSLPLAFRIARLFGRPIEAIFVQ